MTNENLVLNGIIQAIWWNLHQWLFCAKTCDVLVTDSLVKQGFYCYPICIALTDLFRMR